MSLIFDGVGHIDLAAPWVPTDLGNFEVEILFTLPSTGNRGFLSGSSNRANIQTLSSNLYFQWEVAGSGSSFRYATSANPSANVETRLRFKVINSATVEVYKDGAATPTQVLDFTGDEITAYGISRIGKKLDGNYTLPAGSEMHEVRLTDLNTAANSSVYLFDQTSGTTLVDSGPLGNDGTLVGFADPNSAWADAPAIPSVRKGSTFDAETTLSGTVTAATLNAVDVSDHITGQVGTTVSFDGGLTAEITTSGAYDLVLTDDSADPDETISIQVNVYGVVPSDNPWQKEGTPLADLTGVQYRVVNSAALNGTGLFYTAAGTTDASGNVPTFDVSDSSAGAGDPVHIVGLSAAGDSLVAPETVELI